MTTELAMLLFSLTNTTPASSSGDEHNKRLSSPSHMSNFYPFVETLAESQKRQFSYLRGVWPDLKTWRDEGRAKMMEHLRYEPGPVEMRAEILSEAKKPGYTRYHVRYPVAPDRATEAFLLVPKGRSEPGPAVVALHDHGGYYYHGKEKITETEDPPRVLAEHIESSYGGRPFADELARRGFVVLVPDGFYFGSQRLDPTQLPAGYVGRLDGLKPGSDAYIRAFQSIASKHEEIVAKTLFAAGTTWPGVLFQGDRASVDYLLTRPEVDPTRIGCMGLSIGGFRSAHLTGLDPRIRAGVVVGWMTTYASLLYDHIQNHTWMIYVPGQLAWLDLPDVASLHAPDPLLIIQCSKDHLFTMEGMKQAEKILSQVYEGMDASQYVRCLYMDEPHSFKIPAQEEAISWMERWLK